MKSKPYALLVTILVLVSLGTAETGSGAALTPEVIYYNGKVVTVNDSFDIAEAVAIFDGRIVAVGSNETVRNLASNGTRQVDLGGKTMLPGFYDNHIHLGPGRALQKWNEGLIPAVSEWTRDADTVEKLMAALKEQVANRPKGEWIRGGLTRPDWPNDKVPDRWYLDEVAREHPVVLTRGPHTLILNSLAFELAGIDETTPDPEGGWIIRNEEGIPSGRILEAARRLLEPVLPHDSAPLDKETGLATMRLYLQQLAGLGITSVNIAGIRPNGMALVQELYERWGDELPRATMQIRLRPGYDTYDDPEEGIAVTIQELEGIGFRTGIGNDRLKLGAIKLSIDGGLSAPVFWSAEPYEGKPDFYGAIRIPAEIFYPVARRVHELGWQLGIHTMGDGAVVMVVDQLERILRENPRADHRHHLHHVAVKPPEETIRKMADNDIIVSSQPAFTVGLGAFAVEALTADREETQNPTQSLLDRGVRVSYGSDSAPYGPLLTIWTAVTRKGWQGKVYGPEEAVSVETAIRLHTMESAYMTFDEHSRGSIEVGKLADMVVLGEDILTVDPDRIRSISIEKTIVGGKEIYTAGGSQVTDSPN